MTQQIVVVILFAYLIGSIPFSQLISRWRTGHNLREVGEGNVGSRNVWHVVGPSWGLSAALLDCLKGYAVYRVSSLIVPPAGALMAGVAVVLGHQFPIFLRGRGGKGLATALGVLIALTPLSSLCALVVLVFGFVLFRDFNPSIVIGIIAIILLPALLREPLWVSGYTLLLAVLAGLKKVLDAPHESRVWRDHPWQDGAATPGWQDTMSDTSDSTSSNSSPEGGHSN